jgi:quercetin dioxygenase-like cupin family protein
MSKDPVPTMKSHTASALLALSASGFCAASSAAAAEPSSAAAPLTVTRAGQTPSMAGSPQNFSGQVRVDMLHAPKEPWRSSSAYVTFEPGARTFWHTHPVGQTLIVTVGAGQVQRWEGPVESIRPGDVVWIPAGVKHWHGATATTAMTHIAITETLDGKNVNWLEAVSDAQYRR